MPAPTPAPSRGRGPGARAKAFVREARKVGGRWNRDAKAWRFDSRNRASVEAALGRCYGWAPGGGPTSDFRITLTWRNAAEREVKIMGRSIARRWRRDAAVTTLTPYGLRDTFATLALAAGIDERHVAIAIRHTSSTQTSLYDRLRDQVERAAGPRLETWLRVPLPEDQT